MRPRAAWLSAALCNRFTCISCNGSIASIEQRKDTEMDDVKPLQLKMPKADIGKLKAQAALAGVSVSKFIVMLSQEYAARKEAEKNG